MSFNPSFNQSADLELRVFLLALSQLDERKDAEKKLAIEAEKIAAREGIEIVKTDRTNPSTYDRNYAKIEHFILKMLERRWKMTLKRER